MNDFLSGVTLASESRQQEKWQLRPQYAGTKIFDNLLKNEFIPVAESRKRQRHVLQYLFNFCASSVPYYRRLFSNMNTGRFDNYEPEDLLEIPILTKTEVQEYRNDLLAENLPRGESVGGLVRTSGTTGHPIAVLHSKRSRIYFTYLKQRELRWFRFNPKLVLAAIRSAKDLPPKPDGKRISLGETSCIPFWQNVGPFFETGQFYGFMWTNPLEAQKEWLARVKPAYLVGQSADLEHLALGYAGEKTPSGLKGIFAISQELTEEMEERIKNTFNVPVSLNYGLNEIGIVASRCPEGGRYHVHPEHCFVEIVDDEGKICRPGQRGRIIVTALNNLVMPLIRYDTDDLAEVAEGPCPCGRTLPSFGRIHGRYRRLAALPSGTMNFLSAIIGAIDDMPEDIIKYLRQYNLHQFKDGSFELSIVASTPMGPVFREKIMEKWKKAGSPVNHPVNIKEVGSIPRSQGGKFQKFTSDFMPIQQLNIDNSEAPR